MDDSTIFCILLTFHIRKLVRLIPSAAVSLLEKAAAAQCGSSFPRIHLDRSFSQRESHRIPKSLLVPTVYSRNTFRPSSFDFVSRELTTGSVVEIRNHEDRLSAYGLLHKDPHGDTSVVIFHVLSPQSMEPINESFWFVQLEQILRRKRKHLPFQTSAFRLLNSASDGFPGLCVDIYHQTVRLSVTHHISLPLISPLLRFAQQELFSQRVFIRFGHFPPFQQITELTEDDWFLVGPSLPSQKQELTYSECGQSFQSSLSEPDKWLNLHLRPVRSFIRSFSNSKTVLTLGDESQSGFARAATAAGAESSGGAKQVIAITDDDSLQNVTKISPASFQGMDVCCDLICLTSTILQQDRKQLETLVSIIEKQLTRFNESMLVCLAETLPNYNGAQHFSCLLEARGIRCHIVREFDTSIDFPRQTKRDLLNLSDFLLDLDQPAATILQLS